MNSVFSYSGTESRQSFIQRRKFTCWSSRDHMIVTISHWMGSILEDIACLDRCIFRRHNFLKTDSTDNVSYFLPFPKWLWNPGLPYILPQMSHWLYSNSTETHSRDFWWVTFLQSGCCDLSPLMIRRKDTDILTMVLCMPPFIAMT